MDSLYDHLPLFNEYLEDGHLQLCQWQEAGKSANEALPDLHALTDHKESWRALIVRYEDDAPMCRFAHAPDNPYDFITSPAALSDPLDVPLIRLCSQLSRPLEVGRWQRVSSYENDAHVPGAYDGVYPDSIILVSVRHTDALLQVSEGTTRICREDFAHENGYPSQCRFAVIDRIFQGSKRKIEDDFDFWSTVMILAANPVDSSLMRAYTLHSLRIEKNREAMSRLFAHKDRQLAAVILRMDHILENASVRLEQHEGRYPDYWIHIDEVKSDDLSRPSSIQPADYLRLSALPAQQSEAFAMQAAQNRQALKERFEHAPEDLERTVPIVLRRSGYEPKEVDILSLVQLERLRDEIASLNLKLVDELAALPSIQFTQGDALDQAASKVCRLLKNRMPLSTALGGAASLGAASFASCIPGWVRFVGGQMDSWQMLVVLSILLPGAPFGAMALEFWRQKRQIRLAIEEWNRLAGQQTAEIEEYRRRYRTYLSDLISLRRARSYYEIALEKSRAQEDRQREMERLQERLIEWRKNLRTWGEAMRIGYSTEAWNLPADDREEIRRIEQMSGDGLMCMEFQKQLFSLEPGYEGWMDLDELGREIPSPFSFVRQLHVGSLFGRRDAYD